MVDGRRLLLHYNSFLPFPQVVWRETEEEEEEEEEEEQKEEMEEEEEEANLQLPR